MAKTAGKTGLIFAGSYARPSAGARACPYALSGPAASGARSLRDRPPPRKKFWSWERKTAAPLVCEKISPISVWGGGVTVPTAAKPTENMTQHLTQAEREARE